MLPTSLCLKSSPAVSQSAEVDPIITNPLFWLFNLHYR